MAPGRLTVVGTGIKLAAHATVEARATIEQADKVHYLVAEPATGQWIRSLNYRARSLHDLFVDGKPRVDIYAEVVERILASVRNGLWVCAAFYGHPGVFVRPAQDALDRARREGHRAEMLPAVSALDCLFADLGIDPGREGAQIAEASELLRRGRVPDTATHVILLQIGLIGLSRHTPRAVSTGGLALLAGMLARHYPGQHPAVVYEAAQYATCAPRIGWATVETLAAAPVSQFTTLWLPPRERPSLDARMVERIAALAVEEHVRA